MAEPIVSIVSLDKSKISDEQGFQNSYLTFTFNEDVVAYTVRCVGTNHLTGKVCESKDKYVSTQASLFTVQSASVLSVREFVSFQSNTLISAEISYYELYQEGTNQINVYGKDVNGTWSNYLQS